MNITQTKKKKYDTAMKEQTKNEYLCFYELFNYDDILLNLNLHNFHFYMLLNISII